MIMRITTRAAIASLRRRKQNAAATTPNTVNYNALVAQTVLPVTYDNLSFTGGGTKTAGGAATVLGDVLIGAGTSFSAIAFTHSLHGNWINQGSFVAGSSTVQGD